MPIVNSGVRRGLAAPLHSQRHDHGRAIGSMALGVVALTILWYNRPATSP
jgi:hypothetical protein